jgi:hypothetical protein
LLVTALRCRLNNNWNASKASRYVDLLTVFIGLNSSCREGAYDERELVAIINALEVYKAVRWPLGRTLFIHAIIKQKRTWTTKTPSTSLACFQTISFRQSSSPYRYQSRRFSTT